MATRRRPRFIREGSVGLLVIAGLLVLGTAGLWLKGHSFGRQNYRLFVDFFAVSGLQVGSPVRFRGIKVGRVTHIRPGLKSAEVELTITPAGTVIPRSVLVEANQSGLISETTIDFMPLDAQALATIPPQAKATDPKCDSTIMLCNGDRLRGEIGVSFDELMRTSVRFAELYGDPKFLGNLNQALMNASKAAANMATLSSEMTTTARSLRTDLSVTSRNLQTNMTTLQTNVSGLTQDLRGQVPVLSASVQSVGQAADQMSATTGDLSALLRDNRTQIETTLDNFSDASAEFKIALAQVSPLLQRVQDGKMLENLETFSANAAKASVSLRELVSTASNPGTLVVLYQLLDSARATFQNTEKLTSDLDEITGDPEFRRNLRDLIQGLNKLISSAETLEQQTQIARLLELEPPGPELGSMNPAVPQSHELPPKVAALVAPFHLAPSSPQLQPLKTMSSPTALGTSPLAQRSKANSSPFVVTEQRDQDRVTMLKILRRISFAYPPAVEGFSRRPFNPLTTPSSSNPLDP